MPAIKKPEAQAAPAQPLEDAVDHAIGLVVPSLEFVWANFKAFFLKMLKIGLASAGAAFLAGAIFAILSIVILLLLGVSMTGGMLAPFLSGIERNPIALAALLAWCAAWIIGIMWLSTTISLAAYPIAKEQFEGKYSGLWETCNRIKFKALGYMLLHIAILVIFIGIPLLLLAFFLIHGNDLLFILGALLFAIASFVFLLLYLFLSQFWAWELLVAGKGPFESLKASASLAVGNAFGSLVFDVIRALGFVLLFAPFWIIGSILGLGLQVGAVISLLPGGIIAYLAFIALYVLLRAALEILRTAVTESVILPYSYSFWERIRKK
jgi:hypothetical protein